MCFRPQPESRTARQNKAASTAKRHAAPVLNPNVTAPPFIFLWYIMRGQDAKRHPPALGGAAYGPFEPSRQRTSLPARLAGPLPPRPADRPCWRKPACGTNPDRYETVLPHQRPNGRACAASPSYLPPARSASRQAPPGERTHHQEAAPRRPAQARRHSNQGGGEARAHGRREP